MPAKRDVVKRNNSKLLLQPEDEIKILRSITQTISCSLELSEVLQHIVDTVIEITQADSCLLYLFDDTHEELVLQASKNPHPEILGAIRLKLGEGITGWVAKEKQPVVIPSNACDDPRFKFFHDLPEDTYQSFLSVPIINKDTVIGVINVQDKQSHDYNPNEVFLLSSIAHQVGWAIENARLYEETKRRATQIEALGEVSKAIVSGRYLNEILQLIVTMTAEMMDSKMCSLMLFDGKKQELTVVATQNLDEDCRRQSPIKLHESISGKAVRDGKAVIIPDICDESETIFGQPDKVKGIRSMLAVPMMVTNEVIGVINSYTEAPHRFTGEEVNILQTVANQAAAAIKNTQLMEEAVAAREALETRKLVERAKGLLMKELEIDEHTAHKTIHRKSMDMRRPLREIAEAIIVSAEMRKKI